MKQKTFTPTPADIERQWWVVDAEGKTLGRMATEIARILRGKHKVIYSPHVDVGDYVVVINCDKIVVTGNRMDTKIYYTHSGFMGGLKSRTMRQVMAKHPERVIKSAVKGMLPKGVLGRQMFKKLKVYAGADHPHAAQKPQVLEL
ncbi:MAG: 50S ribosomal protein L13 [Anaerolineaceae bacterium]|nr:MAG: 50S ribosomal protein L13 [Anaerolineaceae bacterium]